MAPPFLGKCPISIAIVNLPGVTSSPGLVALVVAGVADGEGALFDGRETAFAFQSGGVVVRPLGVSGAWSANAPAENAQSPKDTAVGKNRIRAGIERKSKRFD